MEVKSHNGDPQYWLNIICWGTTFQQVKFLAGTGQKTPENVWSTFIDAWARTFGFPEIMVLDPGTEFMRKFQEMMESYGVAVFPIDAKAPWQNGRTERAGDLWKKHFKLARRH